MLVPLIVRRGRPARGPALTGSLLVHAGLAALLAWFSLARPRFDMAGSEPIEMVFEAPPIPDAASAPDPATLPAEPPAAAAMAEPPPQPEAPAPAAIEPAPAEALAAKPAAPVPPEKLAVTVLQRPVRAPTRPAVRARPQPDQVAGAESLVRPPAPAAPPAAVATVDPGWRNALSAWLVAHKRYPEAARRRGDAGVVGVTFTVAHDGRVLVVAVTGPSGSSLLDDAVREMLDRQRLPAFPPEMPQPETQVSVRIRYTLE